MTTLRRPTNPRVAIVSDTVDDINGVAIGLRRLVAASVRAGYPVRLVGAARTGISDEVVRIPAVMEASLPFYAGMTWTVPALPALTTAFANVDLVQLATPGPMGLAALIAARMLGIPVLAQYHTEVADYAARMTGLPFLAGIVSPIVGWFYQQADLCLAPSETVVARLGSLGVPRDRVRRIQRGVDLALFDPARREPTGGPTAIYVGRLSNEKNLGVLERAWSAVHAARPDARLVVVGDGPKPIAGPGILAMGALHGEALATAFASADLFVFPSETETFGNVVVEAAASGIPSIVASAGAAHEHVIDGVTGLVVDGGSSDAFAASMLALFAAPARTKVMGLAARAHALTYDMDRAVAATWRIYRDVIRSRAQEAAA